MEALETITNTPPSVPKKKSVIVHTSAQLKKTIEKIPVKNDWSWIKTATLDDIAKYIKDNNWYKVWIWKLSKDKRSASFITVLTKSDIRNTIKNDPNIYEKVIWVKRKKNIDRSWIKSASTNDISRYIKDQWWYEMWMWKLSRDKSSANFISALIKSDIREIIKKDTTIYKEVFGKEKKDIVERWWLDNASIKDMTQFIKNQWWYGKWHIRMIDSKEDESWLANLFIASLRYRKIIRDEIYKNDHIYKQVFWIEKPVTEKRIWLYNASIDDIAQFIKDQWWYGKGPYYIIKINSAFYTSLQKTYIWNEIQSNSEIYKSVFWTEKNNYIRIRTASANDIIEFIQNKNRYWKGINRINKNGWWGFINQLNKSVLWNEINKNDIVYEKIFGVKRRKSKQWAELKKDTTINDIINIMQRQGYYWKWARRMIWPEWQKIGAGRFYKKIISLPIWIDIKNNKSVYESIFWTNKSEYYHINSVSLLEEKKYIGNIIKENGWYGKGTNRMIWPEWESSGAKLFYNKLVKTSIWNNMQKDMDLYKDIMGILPYKRLYHDKNIEIWFDSLEERRIAVIFYKLWIIERRIEGENLHIKTNWSAKHSIDFKIGHTFLEYHPYNSYTQKNKWWSFSWEAQRKYDNITNTLYKDKFDLIVFDDEITYYNKKTHVWKERRDLCKALFNLIKETPTLTSHIPLDKRRIVLSYDNFKNFYNQISKELSEYDMQSSTTEETQE